MSKTIKVTGILYIEDDEYDPGPNGPLTREAYDEYADSFELDDLRFEVEK